MAWRSNLPRVERALRAALAAGVSAAAHQYADRVGRRLAFGYTSGDFTGGHVAGSVEVTTPHATPRGIEVRVGSNVPYALFWELGHRNLFTRSYERVEIWRPFLLEMRGPMTETLRTRAQAIILAMAGRATGGAAVDVVTGLTREEKRAAVRQVVDG